MKKLGKIIATAAIAGGLLTGATGVANADDWGWDNHGGHGWHDRGWNGGWNGGWRGDPAPGGWNGGWEPWGGVCIFGACV